MLSMELESNLETTVEQIFAINQAWKQAAETLLTPTTGLTISLRNLKTTLQVRLLRNYPQRIYLQIDQETPSEEPLYGLIIDPPLPKYSNAAHLPVRVAQEFLTPQELSQFVRYHSTQES